jgi:hypothetical protein
MGTDMTNSVQMDLTVQRTDLQAAVEALGKAIVTLAEMIAEVLRKVVAEVERIVERATRGVLAVRLSRWIGPRPARWLAQRWPRRWLPTRSLWQWAIAQVLKEHRRQPRRRAQERER